MCISVRVGAFRRKQNEKYPHHTCLVFVFLQNLDSFLLERFNSLFSRLGFVVKIVSLVQSASHLPGVQLQVDYPEHHTSALVAVGVGDARHYKTFVGFWGIF